MTKRTASRLHNRLVMAELNGDIAVDCRRVLRAERMSLGIALDRDDDAAISAAAAEAVRVAAMWGVEVG